MTLALLSPFCTQDSFGNLLPYLPPGVVGTWNQRLPQWTAAFNGSIGYIHGFVYHLWHGSLENRQDFGNLLPACLPVCLSVCLCPRNIIC